MQLWQLRKLSTNEPLNEPQELPNNWGPIFGLSGFVDKLGDLSWLGPQYTDTGWFLVGEINSTLNTAAASEIAWDKAKKLLQESDWTMLPDVPMTSGKRFEWSDYRRLLREIKLQQGFPLNIIWPKKPE